MTTEKRKCKVLQKYASYTTKIIKECLTPIEAIELKNKLMSKPRQPFVAYDVVWMK